MVSLLITLLVLALVVYVACLLINMLIPTQPLNQIIKIIVGIIALVYFLQRTNLLSGHL